MSNIINRDQKVCRCSSGNGVDCYYSLYKCTLCSVLIENLRLTPLGFGVNIFVDRERI